MRPNQTRVLAIALLLAASTVALAMAQSQQKQKPAQKQQPPAGQPAQQQPADQTDEDAPKANFTGQITATGSRNNKDTASAGFKGVGDDGKVTTAALNASPTTADTNAALQLSLVGVSDADLQAFIKDGKLNPGKSKAQ